MALDDERKDAWIATAQRPQKTTQDTPPQSSTPLFALGTLGVVALVVFLVWPRGGEAAVVSPTPLPVTAIPTAVPTAVPTPAGPDLASQVALIEALIGKGDYQTAIATAEGALAVPGIREEQRRVLTGYIVTAGLKDIESTPFEPLDRTQHQHLVDTYLSLVERAKGAGITLDTPLEVARRAQASSQFPLAKVAIETALESGAFNPTTDRDVTRLYVSTLYGLGKWYTTAQKGSPLYEEGLRALVASDMIADRYKTGQSEAEALFAQSGVSERPAPLSTPLLKGD